MKALVLDCSVVFGFHFSDEKNYYCDAVKSALQNGCTALVPALFVQEISNVLLVNERKGRWSFLEIRDFLGHLDDLSIHVAPHLTLTAVTSLFQLAQQHTLTTYDATYLELARREGVLLATQDKALQNAAINAGCFFTGD